MIDIILLLWNDELPGQFVDDFPRTKIVKVDTKELTEETMKAVLRRTLTKYFYIVTNQHVKMVDFDFTYEPNQWEDTFRHVWNNDSTISLINRKHAKTMAAIDMPLKVHNDIIYNTPQHDIVFISYNELTYLDNYNLLKHKYTERVKHVHGIKGIGNAHRLAAQIATTPMVYIVDADAVVVDDFNFSYKPNMHDEYYIHIWKSKNPINGLEYGYGGVKLFPTQMLRNVSEWRMDFTTSVGRGVKLIDSISNITAFNTDAFSAWKSGFRECVKLSSNSIINQDRDTLSRLEVWCTIGNGNFSKDTIAGAQAGALFGNTHRDNPDMLDNINDFDWLKNQYALESPKK